MYFDIGSNVGMWSLANIQYCDKIIAVEASPKIFGILSNNCRGKNIFPLNYAVCNKEKGSEVSFYEANYHTLSTINKDWLVSEKSRFFNQPYKEITCKTIKLDDLIAEYGLPDLIKIDVESGEYECVSSLTVKPDMLCFEWASETNNITFKCLEYLVGLGFTQFYLQFKDTYTFRPAEFFGVEIIKEKLQKTIPKKDWGMLWCK